MLGRSEVKITGDRAREAVEALGGFVYQIYQSALAWIDLEAEQFLFLEVAEDYAVLAENALRAVQVKSTAKAITINSDGVVAVINSFVKLKADNPGLAVSVRYLTTSTVRKENSAEDRVGNVPTLELWRRLAKAGDVSPLRKLLKNSKISNASKAFIRDLDDEAFRTEFLKRIHFDCGAPDETFVKRVLLAKVQKLVLARGGIASQADHCLALMLIALLEKAATRDSDRRFDRAALENLVEESVYVKQKRSHFDRQQELLTNIIGNQQGAGEAAFQPVAPALLKNIPLPRALAARSENQNGILSRLSEHGVGWVVGAAGVGKTLAARIAARRIGGDWLSVNLRGLGSRQAAVQLERISVILSESKSLRGVVLDDLECAFEPEVVDQLLMLMAISDQSDSLIIVTAPRAPASDFVFNAGLKSTIEIKLSDFTQGDIEEILSHLGGIDGKWANYIYAVSVGHPQLAIAAIQSMQALGWDEGKLQSLGALSESNLGVEEIRARTRQRLHQELPEASRRLLERLSLLFGGFKRGFAIELSRVDPILRDGAVAFDALVGSWIDQLDRDRFSLSPLLSGYAVATLSNKEKEAIHFGIADILYKSGSLDPIEADNALVSAWIGHNEPVMVAVCMKIISSENAELKILASQMLALTHMPKDRPIHSDPSANQVVRGAQLLILQHQETEENEFKKALDSFERESGLANEELALGMKFYVYVKLLVAERSAGALESFTEILERLYKILSSPEFAKFLAVGPTGEAEKDKREIVSFLLQNQARQFKRLSELKSMFHWLDQCDAKFRRTLFALFDLPETGFETDMLIRGAWLSENSEKTLRGEEDGTLFLELEELARKWDRTDLAVGCRKFAAILFDEYGSEKDRALKVLDDGLNLYGDTNYELIRAKAKVHFRANDHASNLELARRLIEGDAPLAQSERAFLGREAAISAQKEGDLKSAEKYFQYASRAARDSNLPDMIPMSVGLKADAALAKWHDGDRTNCVRQLMDVLLELEDVDPKSSLRAAHCHAITRHILLWLQRDASDGEKLLPDGSDLRIYEGLVSNPEPHPEIGERPLPPLDMAWYMLAVLDVQTGGEAGLSNDLNRYLKHGPVWEGHFLLSYERSQKSYEKIDIDAFWETLADRVNQLNLTVQRGEYRNIFNPLNPTLGPVPVATRAEQIAFANEIENQIALFAARCLLDRKTAQFDDFVASVDKQSYVAVSTGFSSCLSGASGGSTALERFAELLALERRALTGAVLLSPFQVLELAYKVAESSSTAPTAEVFFPILLSWLTEKWNVISERQRFLLLRPQVNVDEINRVVADPEASPTDKVFNILMAMARANKMGNEAVAIEAIEKSRTTISGRMAKRL